MELRISRVRIIRARPVLRKANHIIMGAFTKWVRSHLRLSKPLWSQRTKTFTQLWLSRPKSISIWFVCCFFCAKIYLKEWSTMQLFYIKSILFEMKYFLWTASKLCYIYTDFWNYIFKSDDYVNRLSTTFTKKFHILIVLCFTSML